MRHCYLCGSTDHSKKDCSKFVPLKRAQGRRLSGEIELENDATPIAELEDEEQIEEEEQIDDEEKTEDEEKIKDEETTTNPAMDEPTASHTKPESPSTIEIAKSPLKKSNQSPKPPRSNQKLTKSPQDYARKTTKRPAPSTPDKNISRKKPAGENIK